ncbi:MAG: hypothetical protein ACLP4R_27475 [Solirubrobacteraceae bacterium]
MISALAEVVKAKLRLFAVAVLRMRVSVVDQLIFVALDPRTSPMSAPRWDLNPEPGIIEP